ncbi:MAG: VCBS repeat-containing protein [Bacteroidota bacterium]
MKYVSWTILILLAAACNTPPAEAPPVEKLFTLMPSAYTGVDFANMLPVDEGFDVFQYRNYYHGGGVAIGDINNDSLPDIFLVSNYESNKLYLNKGSLQFEEISSKAGVSGMKPWSTGVAMADVNGDGLLDIYVCNSGNIDGAGKENELFINQGDLTFTEEAEKYGLADQGYSTHAVFLDYDRDGDLDCYLLNNSFRPVGDFGTENIRHVRDELGGDKLYRNDNGQFKDVSEAAGIYGSVIAFGLGITAGDVNLDGWPDLYISNDFFERDYLYINQQDGTFKEQLTEFMPHISLSSMGADMGDLNGDGYPEIFVTDMLPESDRRLKTLSTFEDYNVHKDKLRQDYYHQYMRNMLHVNNGDNSFSEVGQMAGVHASDWSWGALMADFDNDAQKDILVCNGVFKDVTDQDFLNYLASDATVREALSGKKIDFQKWVDLIPSEPLPNYIYSRSKGMKFQNLSEEWGLDEPSFSNGAAYGDLDRDGDLDLVINNVNQDLFFFRNNSESLRDHHYLRIRFEGEGKNAFGIGARVAVHTPDETLYWEHIPMKGFQSSMDYIAVVGLGKSEKIDSLSVTWQDGRSETKFDVGMNQEIVLEQRLAGPPQTLTGFPPQNLDRVQNPVKVSSNPAKANHLFQEITQQSKADFTHEENEYVDFYRDRLLYHMLSTEGPRLAAGDLNKDGRDDFFVGGAKGKPGAIFLQQPGEKFLKLPTNIFKADTLSEDIGAEFFDADGDGDLDLFVVSGGTEFSANATPLQDRIYLNMGGRIPRFVKSETALPILRKSGSCVRIADVDRDGDQDIFVGGRMIPFYYGVPEKSFLLLNNGKGEFTDATDKIAPDLNKLGMVTDVAWFDYEEDGDMDLLVVGEWMQLQVFQNKGGKLMRLESVPGLDKTGGWWNCIQPADLDGDGDLDFVVGNLGLNAKFTASPEFPLVMYVNDFDRNGSAEQIFCRTDSGAEIPMLLKHDLVGQLNTLKKQFVYYKDYVGKSMQDIFTPDQLERAFRYEAHMFESVVIWNEGKDGFTVEPLPEAAQVSPVYGMSVSDYTDDGRKDILLGGNFFAVKPEVGKYDAMRGVLLEGQADRKLIAKMPKETGFLVPGQVRDLKLLRSGKQPLVVAAQNNGPLKIFRVGSSK